ncbi:MAG: RNase adapter RapZ [Sphingomonadaceae bacterium]|uniref:RNase adapter RapZ n=1 Tax=Thermaurantiacus sp. TaxID=2820283 RepID=UPI00298F148F|nr:RNase adapter RapZ [Thermaurantiacus sp.]MCS6986630.1 RNase adapter RapZ [Sphingomonadaceae bacterium]MDW8414109.1 RNase adapter RapZ [Thermaurantiacus sp.]
MTAPPAKARLMLVTGLSGAGRTTALRALEDAGWEAVDNLPLSLLEPLLAAPLDRPVAVGIDTRTRAFAPEALLAGRAALARGGRSVHLLFLDCGDAELARRFSETRRRHPLAPDRPAVDGIARERVLLAPLRAAADLVIDTTELSPGELRRTLVERVGAAGATALVLTVESFAYARGIPRDADLVFDLRFLRNPHWVAGLRARDGRDADVARYVAQDPLYAPALERLLAFLLGVLPGFVREGRPYLTLAFGCTGGRHRSVAMAEAVSARLAAAGWPNRLVHRDLGQEADDPGPQVRDGGAVPGVGREGA